MAIYARTMSSLPMLTVELTDASGAVLRSVVSGGRRVFVGMPSQEFQVRATLSHCEPRDAYWYFDATVDGQFPGEIRWIQGRTQAVFDGWVCSAAGEKKRAFVFAPVQESGAAAASASAGGGGGGSSSSADVAVSAETGQVSVTLYRGKVSHEPRSDARQPAVPDAVRRGDGDKKKFWDAPALHAGAGRRYVTDGFSAKRIVKDGDGIATVTVLYEDEGNLQLRGVLPTAASGGAASSGGGASSGGAASTARVKRERPPAAAPAYRGLSAAIDVDNPPEEEAAPLCDLTGDEDEGKWGEVAKRRS